MFLQVALSRLELVYKRDGRLLPFWGRHKLDAIERQTVRATLAQMKPGRSRSCSAVAEVSISKRGRTQFEPVTDTARFALTPTVLCNAAVQLFNEGHSTADDIAAMLIGAYVGLYSTRV